MPELVWFTWMGQGAWHAGYSDQMDALCGLEHVCETEPWVRHFECRPANECEACAAAWYKANSAVGSLVLECEEKFRTGGP